MSDQVQMVEKIELSITPLGGGPTRIEIHDMPDHLPSYLGNLASNNVVTCKIVEKRILVHDTH